VFKPINFWQLLSWQLGCFLATGSIDVFFRLIFGSERKKECLIFILIVMMLAR